MEMVNGEPWCWHALDAATTGELQIKLAQFESMTWQEIFRGGSHPIPISTLPPSSRRRLEQLRLDDYEEIVSLRLSGAQRIWGFRTGNVLLLLWWDPHHEVFPTQR